MGIGVGDYNLDLFKTHFTADPIGFYRNHGKGNLTMFSAPLSWG
jgi:hypothetical protein